MKESPPGPALSMTTRGSGAWYQDMAKDKSDCAVEFFHHKQPSSDLLRLKKPLIIRLPHLAGSGEDECRMAWVRGEQS
jgi:hypothetical protein